MRNFVPNLLIYFILYTVFRALLLKVELREVPYKFYQLSQISKLKGFRLLFHVREVVQIFLGYLFFIKYKGNKSTIHAAAYSAYF